MREVDKNKTAHFNRASAPQAVSPPPCFKKIGKIGGRELFPYLREGGDLPEDRLEFGEIVACH
jgi:hypothetical protein